MTDITREQFQQRLTTAFSGYRAEWLGAEVFNLFTQPSYFPQLTTAYPCFLVGGRGAGKTTTLRCLSYQGQAALRSPSFPDAASWPFVGMYYRINTNRVRAFGGSELQPESWSRIFAHYVNMEFSDLVLRFLQWHAQRYPTAPRIGPHALARFAASIHLRDCADVNQAIDALELSRIRFEATINNVADDRIPSLSLQGAPIDQLLTAVMLLPHFQHTSFLFLVDEYENLDRSQQRIINTLIKHCGDLYSFKVGVREFGDSERSTLNGQEKLRHPADYKRIDIDSSLKSRFSDFAARVCRQRMRAVFESPTYYDIRQFFPRLPPEQEATLLGVESVVEAMVAPFRSQLSAEQRLWIEGSPKLEIYVLLRRAEAENVPPILKIEAAITDTRRWKAQYDNYKHAYLFAIRKGRPGIRKYYSGWNIYCRLASSNIRFLLELVDQALTRHAHDDSANPTDPVTAKVQTIAAQDTGMKNLRELEGLSLRGAKLTRFVLGLGRIFQVMAEDPVGHTAEVNQFHLANDVVAGDNRKIVTDLLKEGVMHLALLWYPASKLQERTDIRQFDYAIHPIFAPVLGFNYRRKRKMLLADDDFVNLVERPSDTISKLLREHQRVSDDSVPEQMRLFSELYVDKS